MPNDFRLVSTHLRIRTFLLRPRFCSKIGNLTTDFWLILSVFGRPDLQNALEAELRSKLDYSRIHGGTSNDAKG